METSIVFQCDNICFGFYHYQQVKANWASIINNCTWDQVKGWIELIIYYFYSGFTITGFVSHCPIKFSYSLEKNSCKVGCKGCKQRCSPLSVSHWCIVGVSKWYWILCNTKWGEKQLHIYVMTEVKHSSRLLLTFLYFTVTQCQHCYYFLHSLLIIIYIYIKTRSFICNSCIPGLWKSK